MIETILLGYVLLGAIFGLVIWYSSFDENFDQFVREEYEQDPPTTLEKWWTVFSSLVLWPLYIWKMYKW